MDDELDDLNEVLDNLYAAQLFLATERLRAATAQELQPLWTLAGGNQSRADELRLYVLSQNTAAVMLVGPETAGMRARLDKIDAKYRRMTGETPPAPPALETEDAVAADLAAYRAQPRPAVRSLIVGDSDPVLQRVQSTPPSVLDDSGALEDPITLEAEAEWWSEARTNGANG